MDGPVKNPNRTGCNVCNRNYQFVESSSCSRLTVARKKDCTRSSIAYENEARSVKSLKIQILSRCNEGTIVDGPVKYPNRTGCNVCNRNYQFVESSPCSRLTVARKKG